MRDSPSDVVRGATARSSALSSLRGWSPIDLPRVCTAASLCLTLLGCVTSNGTPTADVAPRDAMDSVGNADFSTRLSLASEGESGRTKESAQPILFPGVDAEPQP